MIKEIEKYTKENDFTGVISIFKKNEIIHSCAYGYKDIKNKVPNDVNTKFGIASGTKLFTALGIGVLIDENKISLETKVGDIDEAYTYFIDEEATVLNLLTHTSGIYDYFDEEYIEDFENYSVGIPWAKLETPSDYLLLFKNKKMKYKPNEKYSYSNGGFVFLGVIIEKLTHWIFRFNLPPIPV